MNYNQGNSSEMKREHCIMIKGSIFQEDIPVFKPFKSKLNREIDKLLLTVVIGDTNIFLLVTDRSSRQKINKDITDVSSIINHLVQLTFIDYFIQPQQEYTFFSSPHGTLTSKEHILGHKTHLSKFKRLKVIQKHFSDHNGIKPEIYNRNDNWKMLPPKLGIISKIYRQMKRKQWTGTMSIVGYHLCNKERGEKYMHVFNCLCTKKNLQKKYIWNEHNNTYFWEREVSGWKTRARQKLFTTHPSEHF